MSGQKNISRVGHAAGLALAGMTVAVLATLWIYGLPYLRGTFFEDLSSIIYAVVAIAFLTLADRIAHAVLQR